MRLLHIAVAVAFTATVVVGCSGSKDNNAATEGSTDLLPRAAVSETSTARTDSSLDTALPTTGVRVIVPSSTMILIPTPLALPSPTPSPTMPAPPTFTPTPVPVPREYANPEIGILRALNDVYGGVNAGSSSVKMLTDRAVYIRSLYHLVTVPPGQFNTDLSGYYEWLKSFVQLMYSSGTPAQDALHQLREHVHQQVIIALTQPDSQIGRSIRILELNANLAKTDSGPLVYWEYLFGPAFIGTMQYGSLVEEAAPRWFQQWYTNYQIAETTAGPNAPDFGTYLVENTNATTVFTPSSSSPTPTPRASTATPTPTTATNVPRDGSTLYDRPLSEWRADDSDYGSIRPTATGLNITVFGGDGEHVMESWTNEADFADISASVDVREVSDHAAAAGCISVRHDTATGDYSFCILGNGRSWAIYNYVDGNGDWQVEVLLDDAVRKGTNASTSWNTLKIVAKGHQLWFIANGVVLASVTDDARIVGDVAISVTNWDEARDAEFEFKNLVVRGVN